MASIGEEESKSFSYNDSQKFKSHSENVLQKFNEYKESGTLCNITLVAGHDNIKVKADRLVLCAACKYLEKIISDSNDEEILLHEINGATLTTIVNCCYKSCGNVNKDNYSFFLQLSIQYGIPSLLHECSKILTEIIKLENCIELFQLAELYQLDEISRYILKYMEHNFRDLKNSESFCNLSLQELQKLLRSNNLTVSSEEDAFFALNNWLQKDYPNRKQHLSVLLPVIRMNELQPEFIQTNIQPLLDTAFVDLNSTKNGDDTLFRSSLSSRKPKVNLWLISSYYDKFKLYYYSCETKDFTFVRNMILYTYDTKNFWAVYNNYFILDSTDILQLFSVDTGRCSVFHHTESFFQIINAILIDHDVYLVTKKRNEDELTKFTKMNIVTKNVTKLTLCCPPYIVSTVPIKNYIFFLTGKSNPLFDSIWRYDTVSTEWIKTELSEGFKIFSNLIVFNGHIHVIKLCEDCKTALIKFDERLDSWSQVTLAPEGLRSIRIVNLNDSLLVMGKRNKKHAVYQFEPNLKDWIKLNDFQWNGTIYWAGTMNSVYHMADLSNNFKSLSEIVMEKVNHYSQSEFLCDVTLVAGNDNIKVRAHKSVLCASSVVFDRMLTGQFKEAKSDEISLQGINSESLKSMVHYCYNGYADITENNFSTVLQISDQYEITKLFHECFEALEKILTVENCIGLFQLVELYQLPEFSKVIMEYIERNFENVKDFESFCNLSFTEIQKILNSDNLLVSSEEDVFFALNKWFQEDSLNRKQHLVDILSLLRMRQLKPEFIQKYIWPLYVETGDIKLGTMLMDSVCSNKFECDILTISANSRKLKNDLLIVTTKYKHKEPFNVYCYSEKIKDFDYCYEMHNINVNSQFLIAHDDNLIIMRGMRKLELYSLDATNRIELYDHYCTLWQAKYPILIGNDLFYFSSVKWNRDYPDFRKINIKTKKETRIRTEYEILRRELLIISAVHLEKDIFFLTGEEPPYCEAIWKYDTAFEKWSLTELPTMIQTESNPVIFKGHIHVVIITEKYVSTLIKFDKKLDSWSQVTVVPEGLLTMDIINLNNTIILGGKRGRKYVLFQYDSHLNTWCKLDHLKWYGEVHWIGTMASKFFIDR